jgi:hypothetical protein
MEYDIVICTTAVSRLNLHNYVIPNYISFLSDLKCLWVINIDQILDENVIDTYENFINLTSSSGIDIDGTFNSTGGTRLDFFNSAKNIIDRAKLVVPKFGYLWLEDDWICFNDNKLKQILTEIKEFDTLDYIQLVPREKTLSFNPGVFSTKLFNASLAKLIHDTNSKFYNINPEATAIFDPYNGYTNLISLVNKYYYYPCFKDVGRTWQRENQFKRTHRTFGSIS